MLSHTGMPPHLVDEPTFMMLLELELERARRNRRVFSLTRFEVVHSADRDTALADRAVAQIRTCDVAAFVDDHLIVLWSESLPTEVASAIERIVDSGDGSLTWTKSVSFPENALTRSTLLSQVLSPPVDIPHQAYSTDVRPCRAPDEIVREAE
jgi:hypothetical protein